MDCLNVFVPDTIRNKETFAKIKGGRKQFNGWSIVATLTRSEVKEGIANYVPEQDVYYTPEQGQIFSDQENE